MQKQETAKRKRDRLRLAIEMSGFIVALLLSRIHIGGGYAPFGLGTLLAVTLSGCSPLFALGGMLIGAFMGASPLFGAMLSAVLFVALLKLFRLFHKRISAAVKVLVLLLCQLASLPFTLEYELISVCFALLSLGVSILAGILMFWTLKTIKALSSRRALNEWEQTLTATALSLLLTGLFDAAAFSISLPVIVILFCSMTAVYAKGAAGALYGVLLAAGLVVQGAADLTLVGSAAFCIIAASTVANFGSYAIVGAFLLAGLLTQTLWAEGTHVVNAQNLLLSSIPFLIMPKEWLLIISGYLNSRRLRLHSSALAMRRMQSKAADEMAKTAAICEDIAGLFIPENTEDRQTSMLKQWTVHGAMRVCAECEARVLCWKDAERMGETLLRLARSADDGETMQIEPPVDKDCTHFSQMIASACLSYNQALAQQANTILLGRQYAFVNRQLLGIGQVLSGLAVRVKEDKWIDDRLESELLPALEKQGIPVISVDALYPHEHLLLRISVDLNKGTTAAEVQKAVSGYLKHPVRLLQVERRGMLGVFELEEAQKLRASMAVVSVPEQKDGISGDATGEFRLAGGQVLYALSDGMGSGIEAHKESSTAIELLFNLYRIGFSRELIYENVNRLLLTKAGSEMYATLDAVALDLSAGKAEVVKFGAPPTFLLRGGRVIRLSGEALPCGIVDEAKPSTTEVKIRKNDMIIMLSDGVYDVLGDNAERAIVKNKAGELKGIANALINAALTRGQQDDMTVMVIRVA
ncbi:MAG: SpoIIE family protein phosphatase [Clostridia bacterium]|nr:SpoIIE family protein phosphatase [Clostridia bacterium]